MEWFDSSTGEASIAAASRHLRARAADVEPVARRPGARVHFDIVRSGGVERAVAVRLRHAECPKNLIQPMISDIVSLPPFHPTPGATG